MALEEGHQPRVLLLLGLQHQRGQHRNQRQCQDQRARHRKADVERHRLEHLAFQPLQAEQRQEHHDDDQDRKRNGVGDFARRGEHRSGAVHRFSVRLALGHDAEGVLHHHHRAIHHHADADREARQRHQVGRKPGLTHADEGDQHRERQGDHHHQRAAQFAQKQEQHQRDQD